MIGAIVGDIVGSRFELNNRRSKDFKFFHPDCHVTDDTIMTLAVGDALVEYRSNRVDLAGSVARKMRLWGTHYLNVGYGPTMHVSFCGWAGTTLKESLWMAHEVTQVAHDHPEMVAGAEMIAALVFLARCGIGRDDLRKYAEMNCRKVPQVIVAFLESTDFVDAIRNAVSLGGDSDTIAAITGSIAEAFYGVPEVVREKALQYLDSRQKKTLLECERKLFHSHVTGSGWDALDADGSYAASIDPECAVEMGLIPSLQDLLEEDCIGVSKEAS